MNRSKSQAIVVTDDNFKEQVLQSEKPVLVDFWAGWCGPCKMLAPLIEEIAKEFTEKIKVAKINVDDNGKVPAEFGIMSIPTILLFKEGEVVNRLVGYQPKEQIIRFLNEAV